MLTFERLEEERKSYAVPTKMIFYKKPGFPEEDEVVICTVKKVLANVVFVNLDEYDKEAVIYLSEIAPGRIRNMREYVKEGKRVVCKVLRVDPTRGHVDLSLRRVSSSVARAKNVDYKLEEKAEKILEKVAHGLNISLKDAYERFGKDLINEHGSLNNCFQLLATDKIKLNVPEEVNQLLVQIVKEKIKPPEVSISVILQIESYSEDGVIRIKNLLKGIKDKAKKNSYKINLLYIGAPQYRLTVFSQDYKSAEKILDELSVSKFEDGEIEIIRK